ncbi:MAG: hypothetical protein IJW59_04550 [Clostridia bacterium]|nr:hypothetical protein [Clostridia bacterium]
MCDKSIKATKSVVLLSILWLIVFVMILQLATSKNIDAGFTSYLTTTFKHSITAGGILFAVLVYPFYALTYSLASYIILSVILIVVTAFLIDRIRYQILNQNVMSVTDSNVEKVGNQMSEMEDEEFEEEMALISNENSQSSVAQDIDNDIFIEDEEEYTQKEEAKELLGLSKERTIRDLDNISKSNNVDEEPQQTISTVNMSSNTNKPNIIVHEDIFDSVSSSKTIISNSNENKSKQEMLKQEQLKKVEEDRKKAALDYLNINKGNFNSKKLPKGIDNVAPQEEKTQNNFDTNPSFDNNFSNNTTNTNPLGVNRLANLTQRLGQVDTNTMGANNQVQQSRDIYDENLTKRNYEPPRQQVTLTLDPQPFIPKKAQEVYSGEVNDNIVDSTGFRPVQVSMVDPIRPKPQQKVYKKPPVYIKPPVDLLKKFPPPVESDNQYMMEKGERIVETLKSFRLDANIINAIKGPTFTRYELQMAPGISVNAVNGKVNDLAMVLESSCRIQIPILGKNAFGIEVPNKDRVTVGLREIIESSNFQNSKSPLTFALGKNISGECKVSAINELVHTLVAGSTGSGKSVCLNTMLLSLLYKASPDELKLLLVDPKMVEFTPFNDLPHMLIPKTITDCDKAVMALNWLVEEMERRYAKLGAIQVRNIDEYNESTEVLTGTIPKMFYIVMIFDEVGDFMTIAKKEIEDKVKRLAAKSRACGIHLVLATQRPTVDVITGTIKANLPSRIAFAVNSYQDSKTILESAGAESLLGMGDMLFLPKGTNDLNRIQGCFVSNKELKAVIEFIKQNNPCEFDEQIEDQMFNKKDGFDPTNGAEEAFDPMMKDCLRYFIKAKKASASSLQANFGIGYPKANKIVMQMEKAGFVSPGDNNGRRTLFITPQEFEERFGEDLDE